MARRVANLLALAAAAAAAAAKCEVLRSLEFQQHTAPKGVSELLGPVVSLVSEKAEVGDIRIRWDGELGLHRVGTHKIVAENEGACFETIIVVKDTDECTVDADLLAEIERLRERATTYGLVAAVAVALCIITVIVASNAQTASAATARANTPIKVVSYQSLAPEQVEKAPYRSPFDSPTI